MNWKKIDQNWKAFVREYNLKDLSGERNYFYGKIEEYSATENFQGFDIYYRNNFNKSASIGSSFRVGHCMTIISPIELAQKWRFSICKNSLWKRIFSSSEKLKVEPADPKIMQLLPLEDITVIASFFPDLKISIRDFENKNSEQIPYGQTILILETKFQPQELEHLQRSREVISSILQKLSKKTKIQNK